MKNKVEKVRFCPKCGSTEIMPVGELAYDYDYCKKCGFQKDFTETRDISKIPEFQTFPEKVIKKKAK